MYSFRIKIPMTDRSRISAHNPIEQLQADPEVRIRNFDSSQALSAASCLIVESHGYASNDEAKVTADRVFRALRFAMVKHRLAPHALPTASEGGFTKFAKDLLGNGTGRPALDDLVGVQTYPTEPTPLFWGVGPGAIQMAYPISGLRSSYEQFHAEDRPLPDKLALAIEFFNLSILAPSTNLRLVTLVMAVEAISKPEKRSPAAVSLVTKFIEELKTADGLDPDDLNSMNGSLAFLKKQSINQACGTCVKQFLGDGRYGGKPSVEFFKHCYNLRSRIAHGEHLDELDGVPVAAAELEVLVADLITHWGPG